MDENTNIATSQEIPQAQPTVNNLITKIKQLPKKYLVIGAGALAFILALVIALPIALSSSGARTPEQLAAQIERAIERGNGRALFNLLVDSQASNSAIQELWGVSRREVIAGIEDEIDGLVFRFQGVNAPASSNMIGALNDIERMGLRATDFTALTFNILDLEIGWSDIDDLLAVQIGRRWFLAEW